MKGLFQAVKVLVEAVLVCSTNEGSESASCDQKLASPGLYTDKKEKKNFPYI